MCRIVSPAVGGKGITKQESHSAFSSASIGNSFWSKGKPVVFKHRCVTFLGGWVFFQGPGMARKFSAPGQLCISMTSSLGATPISAASATSLGPFTKAMCPPQQYGYPAASFAAPWSATSGPAQPPLGQFQPVGAASLQSFNISNLQKSISNPPGSNLRTT